VGRALEGEVAWLADWVQRPPQTNEVGRSAPLAAAARVVAAETGLPLALYELGASAGLNLVFDRIAGEGGLLAPDWRGPPPPDVPLRIVARRGVDLTPLSPVTDALRLRACLWPDQPARRARLEAALAIARDDPPRVEAGDAGEWLAAQLARPAPEGVVRVVFHSIAAQYFPPETRARVARALAGAGAVATPRAPLAHIAMEADGTPGSAALTLQLWPGDEGPRLIARTGFHGERIDWRGWPPPPRP
jgi:hypothetical protein